MSYKKELWTSADVRCPLNKSTDNPKRSISCEGFTDWSKTTTEFSSIPMKNDHMGRFCASKYESCPIYSMVVETKYSN